MKAEDLRKAILQAAVQGKLVPQDKNDEPASELLKRIEAEKIALIKAGKLKKEKPLSPITEDEIPYDLPDGWVWCRLGNILLYTDAGKSPSCKNRAARNGEIGVIRTTAVQLNCFLENENKVLPINYKLDNKMLVQEGDILITRAGPQNRTGIACLVEKCESQIILSDKTVRLNCNGNLLHKAFIVRALNSISVRSLLVEKMTGMAESQVNIAQGSIKNVLFPLPPLPEQQRIVAKADELMVMCDKLEATEKELDTLEDRFAEYLPKSILQTAVQGKLVPQDKNDEPATELLKRIQKEKVQLIKDGKLKKEKPLPPITEEEIPYDLPDGWVWCRLGDITELIMGQSPDGYNVSNNLGGMEFHQGKSCFTEKYLDVSEVNTTQCTKIAPANSVLLAVRAPVGKVNITRRKVCIGRGLCAIIPLGSMILDFVFYWMQSLEAELVSKATGTTFIAVTGEIVKKQLIPLPPLAEQKRIVSKVNELMTLCEDLKQARIMPIAKVVDRVIPFPATTYKHEPVGMAARGMADDLSAKAMQTIANLFEEED